MSERRAAKLEWYLRLVRRHWPPAARQLRPGHWLWSNCEATEWLGRPGRDSGRAGGILSFFMRRPVSPKSDHKELMMMRLPLLSPSPIRPLVPIALACLVGVAAGALLTTATR